MRREKKLSKQPWLELGCCKNLFALGTFIVVIEVTTEKDPLRFSFEMERNQSLQK
jgi:hypothetical protein